MSSLVSHFEDSEYRAAMSDLHDTFTRDILISYTSTKVVISTNINHNQFYSSGPNQTETIETPHQVLKKARIYYKKDLTLSDLFAKSSNDQFDVKSKDWDVKLTVDEDTKNLITKAKRIQFDGYIFDIDSDALPHGVVSIQFYDIKLKAVN